MNNNNETDRCTRANDKNSEYRYHVPAATADWNKGLIETARKAREREAAEREAAEREAEDERRREEALDELISEAERLHLGYE
jgi:hypothetical protein